MNASSPLESPHGGHIFAPIDLVGPGTAGENYLHEFQALDQHAFAVIKIGGGIVNDPVMLERTARAIVYLQDHDLYPVVVHGGGPQINTALEDAGIESAFDPENGNRITSPAAAFLIRTTLSEVNQKLCDTIAAYGGQAVGITQGVFEATLLDEERYGRVGKVERVKDALIHDAINDRKIAVVSCIGSLAVNSLAEEPLPEPLNINGDVAAAALAKKLMPHKFISLTATGAVLDASGARIKALSLRQAERMKRKGTINAGMVPKVDEAFDLLESGIDQVVFISPEALLLELFTDGAGTIIQKHGKGIFRHLFGSVISPRR